MYWLVGFYVDLTIKARVDSFFMKQEKIPSFNQIKERCVIEWPNVKNVRVLSITNFSQEEYTLFYS